MNIKNDIIEISVIIPNFNYGRYIEECITSVIKSDFDLNKLEIIVVDDGSTDNSVSVVNRLITETAANIILIEKEFNSGQPQTRNIGITHSKGNYLFFLDSDNYIKQNCLKQHFEFLSTHTDYSVAYAPIQRFDDVTGEYLAVFSNETYDPDKLARENYIDNMAMVRRDDFVEVGMFDENVIGWEDYELWLKLRNNNKKMFFIEGEPLSFYRVHDNSWSNTVSIVHQQALKSYIDAKHGLDISKGVDNINIPDAYKITSIKRAKIQISWSDEEFVFDEKNIQVKYIHLIKSVNTIHFQINSRKTDVHYIKINLGDRVGFLNIHNIIIQDGEGSYLWEWTKNEISSKSELVLIETEDFFQGKTIQLSTGFNPGFIVKPINANKGIRELNVQISLSYVDEEQYNLLNSVVTKPLTYISPEDILALQATINSLNDEKTYLFTQAQNDHTHISNLENQVLILDQHIQTGKLFIQELVVEKEEKNKIISANIKEKENLETQLKDLNKLLKELIDQKKKLLSMAVKQQTQLFDLIEQCDEQK